MTGFQFYNLNTVLQMLADKYESVPFWDTTEATDAINEALYVWNSLTGYWKTTITIPTTAGNFEYALPSTLVFGTHIEYNGVGLAPASQAEMDDGRPGWQTETTASGGGVPTTPKKWWPIDLSLIAIWPADAVGNGTLSIDGIAATPFLVNTFDLINVGRDVMTALLGYALHVLALKEGGPRFEATMPYFQGFLNVAAEENDQLMASEMFRHFLGTDMRRQARNTRETPTDYAKLGQDQ